MLKLQNISKKFGGIKAVDDCTFSVQKNSITALIGPNGSGKSTIFNLISGTEKVDLGKIKFKNDDITDLSVEKISNQGISRLFQQNNLFTNLTVEDNLKLAINNEDTKFWKSLLGFVSYNENKNKIQDCLQQIDMVKYKDVLASKLSYGQQRLIALQRAIINPHSLLLLDEPVAGVNPQLRAKIKEILQELKKQGDTILLIEHDMNFTLSVADKVIVLEKGKVIAEGEPKEIKNNKRVLQAYLGE